MADPTNDERLEDKRRILALQDAVIECGVSYKKLRLKSRKERDDYRAMIALLKAEVKKLEENLANAEQQFQQKVTEVAAEMIRADRAEETLRKIVHEWQFGGWTVLTKPLKTATFPSLTAGQIVTGWLKEHIEKEN